MTRTANPEFNARVPLCDLTQQYLALRPEIDAAMQAVAASGHYILGPNVKALERELAEFCGCRFAIGVGNGTDALHLALRALGVGPGDEVITTPFTFIASTEAIGLVGATPVFVDIDPTTFNLDPDLIRSAITPRTKALLPVHLYGQPCDMAPIQEIAAEYGLQMVEDCAQALGAVYRGRSVGTFGDLGCLSFFPSKNLGCFGDGGMVLTNNEQLFERVEYLRRHGGRVKYHHEELGLNSRLDELQAAILRLKLPHLPRWNALRRAKANYYNRMLAACDSIQLPAELSAGNDPFYAVYHQYTIRLPERDGVAEHLARDGIGTAVYYPQPLHLQPVNAGLGYRAGAFPQAESAARSCLSLPMFPELTDEQQQTVVARLVAHIGARPTALQRAG